MTQCRTDAVRRPVRVRYPVAVATLLLAFSALSACSTADVDKLQKEFGALPEGAPRRSETPPPYPAVHDMPPARSKALMDEDQQKRMEADLVATRSRLQGRQKQAVKDAQNAQKQAAGERPSAESPRPAVQTVKRGRKPTALSQDSQTGTANPVAAKPSAAQPAADAPPWPTPPAPDGSGFRRNP